MTYESLGNVLTARGKTYTYNKANRMASSNNGSITTNYLVNFMGQRTKKSSSSTATWFIYDENDQLIAEYNASGSLVNEYVYLNDRPIALVRSNNLYYIYTDHLGTPRAITNNSNSLQWTWENREAFGNNVPTEQIPGFKFNLRFPGQYFDSETNLNYNIHRDYNPNWGRYMSSDPLGLAAGINTYGYVNGNSLGWSDRLGLDIWGNDMSLKYIELSVSRVLEWLCYAQKNTTGFITPYQILQDARDSSTSAIFRERDPNKIEQIPYGLDKYDSNLIAAERYLEGYYGNFGRGYILLQGLSKASRDYAPLKWRFPNGSKSEDSQFITTFGFVGVNDKEAKNKIRGYDECNCFK